MNKFKLPATKLFQNLRAPNSSVSGSELAHSDATHKAHGLYAWMKCKARVKRGWKRTNRYTEGALGRVTQQFVNSSTFQSLRAWMECKENSRNEGVVLSGTTPESRKNIDAAVHQECQSAQPAPLVGRIGMARSSGGMILPTILIVMLIVMIVGLSLTTFVLAQLDRTERGVMTANAMLAAEAGAEQTLHRLNEDQLFEGFPSEEVFTDTSDGRATYQTRIEEGDISNEKIITSTGRYYAPNALDEEAVKRSVELVVVGTTTDDFSVQTGPGGLIMNNQATIANGDVHVNGYLDMSNHARIGSPDNPANVYVAHINCPDTGGEDYPRACNSSEGEPITIENPAHIYGEVRANNQIDDSHMSDPGLVENSGVDYNPLPTFDRPSVGEVISEEGQNVLAANASCTQNNGQRTWLNNTRIINGDAEINRNCTVTIEGNVWINQNLLMSNSGTIKVSDDLEEAPIVMIDGSSGIEMRNSSRILTNADGIGVRFITFYSEASCSPSCSDGEVTGQDLYDSRDIVTVNLRNSSLAAGTSFYARWTKAIFNQSGAIGSIMAQTVELSNTGNISFGTELSSGETVWAIKNYQQVFE